MAVRIADDVVEVEHQGRQNLRAAECEKLPRQIDRITAGVENLHRICVRWIVWWQTLDDVLAAPDNDGEQVVEVVGDAARQPADGFRACPYGANGRIDLRRAC